MQTAYTTLAGLPSPTIVGWGTGNIGSAFGAAYSSLAGGVYKWTTGVTITGTLTLTGSASATWVFQIAGTLTVSSSAQIILSGGAQASNIYW
jgi:hypothetical protein